MFSIAFLNTLRAAELDTTISELRPGARILEFGAGTGLQAKKLAELGFDVVAIDLRSSGYAQSRVYPVIDYDGTNIPLPEDSVDIIFSSNVLEHVDNFRQIAHEFRRVTRAGGFGVHIMPSVAWRAWTFASGFPNAAIVAGAAAGHLFRPPAGSGRASGLKHDAKMLATSLLPLGHGTSIEGISELWTFSAAAWRRRFRQHGFEIERERPIGLFHTDHSLFGARISIERRQGLARLLGSAANLFVVRVASRPTASARYHSKIGT